MVKFSALLVIFDEQTSLPKELKPQVELFRSVETLDL